MKAEHQKVRKELLPAGKRPLRLTFERTAESTAAVCAKLLLLELARESEKAETFIKMNGDAVGRVVLETLLSIRRAGADMIFTYYARPAARWLRELDVERTQPWSEA